MCPWLATSRQLRVLTSHDISLDALNLTTRGRTSHGKQVGRRKLNEFSIRIQQSDWRTLWERIEQRRLGDEQREIVIHCSMSLEDIYHAADDDREPHVVCIIVVIVVSVVVDAVVHVERIRV